MTIAGIGEINSDIPAGFDAKVRTITQRQIASLVGLAPRANDSGKFKGYPHTAHGQDFIKPVLFLATMAARNSHSSLKIFYNALISRGKKKRVALTALMRKIIIIPHANLKNLAENIFAPTELIQNCSFYIFSGWLRCLRSSQ